MLLRHLSQSTNESGTYFEHVKGTRTASPFNVNLAQLALETSATSAFGEVSIQSHVSCHRNGDCLCLSPFLKMLYGAAMALQSGQVTTKDVLTQSSLKLRSKSRCTLKRLLTWRCVYVSLRLLALRVTETPALHTINHANLFKACTRRSRHGCFRWLNT